MVCFGHFANSTLLRIQVLVFRWRDAIGYDDIKSAIGRNLVLTARKLVATDLDGTFIGDDTAMHRLWDRLAESGISVAFSTGRHLKSIHDFYEERSVSRRADVCICMVGTDIYFRRNGEYSLDEQWHQIISHAWDKETISRLTDAIDEIRMQDAEWQSPFKSSYYLEENAQTRLAEVRDRMEQAGLQAKIVYSADRFLDLLPIRSGKGEAVRYVAKQMGIEPANVVTCGDTGNDLDMMRDELGFNSIAVGNAAPELKAFRAPRVYHAEARFAAGITEGLERLGWLTR